MMRKRNNVKMSRRCDHCWTMMEFKEKDVVKKKEKYFSTWDSEIDVFGILITKNNKPIETLLSTKTKRFEYSEIKRSVKCGFCSKIGYTGTTDNKKTGKSKKTKWTDTRVPYKDKKEKWIQKERKAINISFMKNSLITICCIIGCIFFAFLLLDSSEEKKEVDNLYQNSKNVYTKCNETYIKILNDEQGKPVFKLIKCKDNGYTLDLIDLRGK